MWEAIKVISGVVLLIGIVLALATTIFVFSWVFKIIGFLLAIVVTVVLVGYIAWELFSGWWDQRKG